MPKSPRAPALLLGFAPLCAPFPALRTATISSADSAVATLSGGVALPALAHVELRGGIPLCRIITSIGQAGRYETAAELKTAFEDMSALLAAGFTSFDLSDHFVTEKKQDHVTLGEGSNLVLTGTITIGENYLAEDYSNTETFVGAFVDRLGGDAVAQALNLSFHTHWAPPPLMLSLDEVREALDAIVTRTRRRRLDLVAVHWWEASNVESHLSTLSSAFQLTAPPSELARAVGLTNFDTPTLTAVYDGLVPELRGAFVSNQVSYSLIDTRAADGGMVAAAATRNVSLIAYGTTLGGLLGERWLGKQPPGTLQLAASPTLAKYYGFVKAWSRGEWALFQELLRVLHDAATRHGGGATIGTAATSWVLAQPGVGGVVVGARLGQGAAALERYVGAQAVTLDLQFSEAELALLAMVQRRGRPLLEVYGDCGHEAHGGGAGG